MELKHFIVLSLLAVTVEHINICRAQSGVCYRSVSSSVPTTTYSSVPQLSFYSCGWLGSSVCQRTTYHRVSATSFRTVYSSQFGCCTGYQQSGLTCTPVCSTNCANNGLCTAPDTCMCQTGWTGSTCQNDIDECASDTDNCEQLCTNTEGSFECSCNVGYSLASDDFSCTDINECEVSNGGCDHNCTNNEGSFQCSCRSGYSLGSDGLDCFDIDECQSNNGGCEHVCTNTEGSRTCSCNQGYALSSNNIDCVDVNECQTNDGGCGQICRNTVGSFECSCNQGFVLASNGFDCTDVDECQTNMGGCEHACFNTEGSFTCDCQPGYLLAADGSGCSDINECQSSNGGCEQSCMNTLGSFVCSCDSGYTLGSDGLSCRDIDECQTNQGGCEQNCINTNGSFVCSCRQGFSLASDRLHCDDIDECQTNQGGCEETCTNTNGSFLCFCQQGFSLASDQLHCDDVDECLGGNSGGCEQNCNNLLGSFECSCRQGYMLTSDGFTCNDINECQTNVCDHNCSNTIGSFQCFCRAGYALGGDGVTCNEAVPSLAPAITSLQRSSATSARISWDPIPHQNRNGDLVAYHLGYGVAVNGSCVTLAPGNELTTLASASASVGFLTNLDPLKSYCVRVAGATIHGVGVFGRLWKVSLYANSLFQVRFSGVTNCSEWMLVDGSEKLEYFTQSMTSLTESLCDCTTAGYLGETTMICDTSFLNEFAIQGRIVGTPTVSSNQIIEQLQNFVSGEPSSIVYQGQTFSYIQRCSVELTSLGRTSCTSVEQSTTIFIPSEKTSTQTPSLDMMTNIPYELVGGVAGGVVLLIIIVSVIVIAVLIFKKLGRGRGYGIESKKTVDMEPKAIDIHNVHKSNEEPLYDSITDNPYYKQLNQRYVQDKNHYTSTKKRSNDHDQGEYYMNDNCGPSNEQNYEDMNCGSDQQYNYISTSRKHSTPLGQSVKEQAYTGNTMKQLEVEEYVEMETKLEDDSAYTDLETVQNYETPLSLKDNTLADENVHLSYL